MAPPRVPPYRLGLVGLGWVVENAYAPALLERPQHWAVRALCDPEPRARAKFRRKWPDTQACESFEQVVSLPLDALLIATPNFLHLEQSLAALRSGMNCLCEKPAIADLDGAARLAAAETDAARYMQATVCRYRQDVAAWLAACREVAPLLSVEAEWLRHQGVPSASAWHLAARPGWTGVFADLGYHLVDLIGAALDYPAAALEGLAASSTSTGHAPAAAWYGDRGPCSHDVADRFAMSASLSGVALRLEVAWVDATPGDVTRLVAVGENGSAILEGLFGYSTQRRVLNQRVTCFDRSGALRHTQVFAPGPDLHKLAFGTLLDAFADRIGAAHPIDQRDLAFTGRFIDNVRRACPAA